MLKKKEEKSPFIRFLEWGEEVGQTGASIDDATQWATANGYSTRFAHFHYRECFQGTHNSKVLKMEYYSRLIEWRELQEARKASSQANRNAIRAIIISVLAVGVTVWFGWQQLNRPIELGDETIQNIEKIIKNR